MMGRKIRAHRPFRLSVVVGGIILSAAVHAGVYRWVDENGVTVYSQVPPPEVETEKKQIDLPPPPGNTQQEPGQNLEQTWRDMRDRQDLTKEQGDADAEHEQRQQAEETNCGIARRTLEQLDNSERRLVKTASGYTREMTDSERKKRLDKAREMEQKFCK